MDKGRTVIFRGKSGARYRFYAWPLSTRFKAFGAVCLVTRREYLDSTFATRATHHCLAIGHTADLGASVLRERELRTLVDRGANCICVCAVADELLRVEIHGDVAEANAQWGRQLHVLFRDDMPAGRAGSPDSSQDGEVAPRG
jgi:hypothetical protein